MPGEKQVGERKLQYREKMENLIEKYKKVIIVNVDNVGSNQMQKVRIALRGKGVLLMGKNTIMRKVIRDLKESNPNIEKLLPLVQGNIGFVFTGNDLKEVRKIIVENKVPAAARSGTLAPIDVVVPAGPTGLDPGQTGFFQAVNIPTKIVKGAVEIVSDVVLIRAGDKVNPSHVGLLGKLNIKPFFYGFQVLSVYDDGFVFDADVLDISNEALLSKFHSAVRYLTAISLAAGLPNATTVPHSIARGFKKLVAIALTSDVTFKQAEGFKLYHKDPAAFAKEFGGAGGASAPAAAPAAAAAAPAAQNKAPAKPKEPEPEPDQDLGLGGGLFD